MKTGVKFWITATPGNMSTVSQSAELAESLGYDGICFGDSQCKYGDSIIAMTLAAAATESLQLGTSVTNPYTRHPAVMAGAFASLQVVSGGRVMLGIGRGDSALFSLGLAPAPSGYFRKYLRALQAYLRGEEVQFRDLPSSSLPTIDTMPPGHDAFPTVSQMTWLPADLPKVPVDVAATGPKTIALAATIADRITFMVGADPQRLRWAIDHARDARATAGLDPDGLSFGAHIGMVVNDDRAVARELGAEMRAGQVSFSVMYGSVASPVDEPTKAALERLRDEFVMDPQAVRAQDRTALEQFEDRFGIYGPPEHCIERLRELPDELELVNIMRPMKGLDDPDDVTMRRVGDEVIPAFRSATATAAGA